MVGGVISRTSPNLHVVVIVVVVHILHTLHTLHILKAKTRTHQCTNTPMHKHTNAQTHQCTKTPMHKHTNAQTHQHQHTSTKTNKYTHTHTHTHTNTPLTYLGTIMGPALPGAFTLFASAIISCMHRIDSVKICRVGFLLLLPAHRSNSKQLFSLPHPSQRMSYP